MLGLTLISLDRTYFDFHVPAWDSGRLGTSPKMGISFRLFPRINRS